MRLFLAIDLPESIKRQLDEQLIYIKKDYPHCSWVSKENYHITIHFLGEVSMLNKLKEKIKTILYDQETFYVYSTTLDLFINSKIVMYLNFKREKKLENLALKLRDNLEPNQFNQKKFIPHLSLGRCRIPSKQQYFLLKKKLNRTKVDIEFYIDKVILFQSILGGKKPLYKQIAEFLLLKNNHPPH